MKSRIKTMQISEKIKRKQLPPLLINLRKFAPVYFFLASRIMSMIVTATFSTKITNVTRELVTKAL